MKNFKNILITGVTGFIASNLIVYLVNKYKNINFIGIDKNSYCSNILNIKEIINCENFQFIQSDITDLDFINYIFEIHNIDAILHLAAYTHVDDSFGNSIVYTQNNIVGTHILLEIAKKYKVKLFLQMSTDEVYGSQESISTETSTLDPTNPYSATKAAAEHLVKSYYHSFKLPIIIVRGNNIYGPKQYPEKVIPKFILRLLHNNPCNIQGSGLQKRSFLYVDDLCNAIDIILKNGEIGEIYNIASSDELTINELANKLISILSPDSIINYIQDRNFNDHRYFICSKKLESLGWRQQIFIDDGINKTINWYKENINHWSIDKIGNLIL